MSGQGETQLQEINKLCQGFLNFSDVRSDTEMRSLLDSGEQQILKPWSDGHEFFIYICNKDQDYGCIDISLLSCLSAFAFAQGDSSCLQDVQRKAFQCQHLPGAGFLVNNLGVMFSDNMLYERSKECFDVAYRCFHNVTEDSLGKAVNALNQAVLHRVLGNYKEAHRLSATAASLCHEISIRETKDVSLPHTLLRRVADMLEEFGDCDAFQDIMSIASKASTDDLTKQLLNRRCPDLFELLENPSASFLNGELIRMVINVAKMHRSSSDHDQMLNLLKQLQNAYLCIHGGKSFQYGSLLYQIGCFLHGSGKFSEAERLLKQAEKILTYHLGESHHTVASCKSFLGSCVILKGDDSRALELLKEALTVFKKLNPYHPEVGEILLKFALVDVEEGSLESARKSIQEAMDIFILSCDEVSRKTAMAYFQIGLISHKFDGDLAYWNLSKATEILLHLGLSANHPEVKFFDNLRDLFQLFSGSSAEDGLDKNAKLELLVSEIGIVLESPQEEARPKNVFSKHHFSALAEKELTHSSCQRSTEEYVGNDTKARGKSAEKEREKTGRQLEGKQVGRAYLSIYSCM